MMLESPHVQRHLAPGLVDGEDWTVQRTKVVVVVYQTVEEVEDRYVAVVTAPSKDQVQGSAVIVAGLEVRGKRVVVQSSIVDATAAVEDNCSWNRD